MSDLIGYSSHSDPRLTPPEPPEIPECCGEPMEVTADQYESWAGCTICGENLLLWEAPDDGL